MNLSNTRPRTTAALQHEISIHESALEDQTIQDMATALIHTTLQKLQPTSATSVEQDAQAHHSVITLLLQALKDTNATHRADKAQLTDQLTTQAELIAREDKQLKELANDHHEQDRTIQDQHHILDALQQSNKTSQQRIQATAYLVKAHTSITLIPDHSPTPSPIQDTQEPTMYDV